MTDICESRYFLLPVTLNRKVDMRQHSSTTSNYVCAFSNELTVAMSSTSRMETGVWLWINLVVGYGHNHRVVGGPDLPKIWTDPQLFT